MQPLAGQAQLGAETWVSAVSQVAAAGVPHRRKVHANLMGSAGLQVNLHEGGRTEGLDDVVVGDGITATLDHRELPLVTGVTANRRVNRAAQRIGQALHQRVVNLIDRALLESTLEFGVGALATSHDHQAARTHVQAVHDALTLGCAGGGHGDALAHQRGNYGGAMPTG